MSDFNLTYVQIGDLGDKIGGQKGAKSILSGESIIVPRSDSRTVLRLERKVSVAARRFVIGESFIWNNPKVKFGYIDKRIVNFFGKQEYVSAGELAVHTLLSDTYEGTHNPEILVALGPQSNRFVKLGHFYQLIEMQGLGQEGPLLVNGCSNIAYVLDKNDAPWAVNTYLNLDSRDWGVCIRSVASMSRWGVVQVLSQVV